MIVDTPLSFDGPFPEKPREYPHKPYSHWAICSSLKVQVVLVYLHSNFRGELQETHVFETECKSIESAYRTFHL